MRADWNVADAGLVELRTRVPHRTLDRGHHLVDALQLALWPSPNAVLAANLLEHCGADAENIWTRGWGNEDRGSGGDANAKIDAKKSTWDPGVSRHNFVSGARANQANHGSGGAAMAKIGAYSQHRRSPCQNAPRFAPAKACAWALEAPHGGSDEPPGSATSCSSTWPETAKR